MESAKGSKDAAVALIKQLKRKYIGYGGSIAEFELKGRRPEEAGTAGIFENLFWDQAERPIIKWHHYFSIYDSYFGPWRGKPVRFLEIGVAKGGSLDIWRKFFGDDAVIFGIDIDPKCAEFNGKSGQVRIGSQADVDFLASVVAEMGGVDLVLDDGSHNSHHIRTTFQTLFPMMSVGGTYMIEDLHAAYWSDFAGGYRKASSFIEDIKTMIDDMHHWYHFHGVKQGEVEDLIGGIHLYDSVAVLDRGQVTKPTWSWSSNAAEPGA